MDQPTQQTQPPVPQPVAPTPPPVLEKKSHMKTILFVLLGILFLSAMGAGGYYLGQSNKQTASVTPTPIQDGISCTADALECPDGSFVGRSGPNCEFICPESSGSSSAVPADWKTYTNTPGKFSLYYPSDYKLTENKNGLSLFPPVETFRMSITYTKMEQTTDLAQFIEKTDPCVNEYILTYKKETLFPVTLGKTYFSVAQDTFCGQWGQTHLYTSPDRKMYYDVEIETTGQYKDVKTDVEAIVATFAIKQ